MLGWLVVGLGWLVGGGANARVSTNQPTNPTRSAKAAGHLERDGLAAHRRRPSRPWQSDLRARRV